MDTIIFDQKEHKKDLKNINTLKEDISMEEINQRQNISGINSINKTNKSILDLFNLDKSFSNEFRSTTVLKFVVSISKEQYFIKINYI